MSKGRLEAFSDGVIAIVITIMVLELRVPHTPDLAALAEVSSGILSYLLSFIFLGIYWNNHHHLLQAAERVNGRILWANLHLLFWLSLVPFATGWMGETDFAPIPVALYGAVLWMAALAYYILVRNLLAHHDTKSRLALAIGRDVKGRISLGLYTAAIALAFVNILAALGLYVLVAIIWFIPDRRIERTLPG